MNPKTKTMLLRKVFILTFLAFGLLIVIADNGVPAGATSCDDAFTAYLNADNTYFSAFNLYNYNDPTSCATDCTGSPDPNCVSNCETTRYTSLGNAQLGLQSLALDTCTPTSPDECAQARGRRDDCVAQYDPFSIEDPVELERIFTQYEACLEASKVASCE